LPFLRNCELGPPVSPDVFEIGYKRIVVLGTVSGGLNGWSDALTVGLGV